MGQTHHSHTRDMQRQDEAYDRNAVWARLSDEEKLASLVERGHGHCRQAQKLRDKIA